jgi:hypothetical protein
LTRRRALVCFYADEGNRTLSYQRGWPTALAESELLDTRLVNLATWRGRLQLISEARRSFDVVLLLHSVFSNSQTLSGRMFEAVRRMSTPKTYFIGNEYKSMPEKMAFAEELGVALLITQISSPRVAELYRGRLGCDVAYVPNTGINPGLFSPRTPWRERPIEIGYRGYDAPLYLGHDDRQRLPTAFAAVGGRLGMTLDISLDGRDRFGVSEWAAFLDRCRGTFGCEAGTDFFELDDRTRLAVNDYTARNTEAGFPEVYDRFFRDYPDRVSGRTISGRVVEAAATGTTQILLAGDYAGHFEPDVHYISLRRDLSDLDEAVERLRDEAEATALAVAARHAALSQFTWPRLVERLQTALARVV